MIKKRRFDHYKANLKSIRDAHKDLLSRGHEYLGSEEVEGRNSNYVSHYYKHKDGNTEMQYPTHRLHDVAFKPRVQNIISGEYPKTKTHEHLKEEVEMQQELDENSPFDWKKTKGEIDWKSALKKDASRGISTPNDTGTTVHKAVNKYGAGEDESGDKKPAAPKEKKSVGRPKGSYGSYKIDQGKRQDPAYKAALSAKVRAAKAEGFAARKEFKDLMHAALKKRQAELASGQN